MSTTNNNKGKHLTVIDRNYIEDALALRYPLMIIAEHLGKDPTTISKEGMVYCGLVCCT